MPIQDVMRVAVDEASHSLRVLQITDCHLGAQSGDQLVGMDTDASLDHVLALISRQEHRAELLLATGDLSNHGSPQAYLRLKQKLEPFSFPCAWLAGNHDERKSMIDTVGAVCLPRVVLLGHWAIVLLDSTVPGKVGGKLGAGELQLLRDTLADLDVRYVMVCLHHQPVPVGCTWLDQQQVSDSDDFFAVLAAEKRLRAIVWGHVHQDFCGRHASLPGVKLLASPSTCVQFAPHSPAFKIDTTAPGYRWFELQANGEVETGVSRIEGIELGVDIDSSGY